ncbi:hypothetical protein QTP70_003618 [Hemibagrus guttatus]|uniref:Uncharacterized protein n=1 Tax=Hemibagrus guttatus TaxID=175788 RepID=A0AAE0QRA1_9TELE|nr:hypothetical protein QTP70_003618 [Hemibagrus guttatus]
MVTGIKADNGSQSVGRSVRSSPSSQTLQSSEEYVRVILICCHGHTPLIRRKWGVEWGVDRVGCGVGCGWSGVRSGVWVGVCIEWGAEWGAEWGVGGVGVGMRYM